ncbi:MAG TPA: hypothetical protein VFT64_10055 [Rickettsiales bacterium]|nr:hypothetical protein [Rickettsiales bacterium]
MPIDQTKVEELVAALGGADRLRTVEEASRYLPSGPWRTRNQFGQISSGDFSGRPYTFPTMCLVSGDHNYTRPTSGGNPADELVRLAHQAGLRCDLVSKDIGIRTADELYRSGTWHLCIYGAEGEGRAAMEAFKAAGVESAQTVLEGRGKA